MVLEHQNNQERFNMRGLFPWRLSKSCGQPALEITRDEWISFRDFTFCCGLRHLHIRTTLLYSSTIITYSKGNNLPIGFIVLPHCLLCWCHVVDRSKSIDRNYGDANFYRKYCLANNIQPHSHSSTASTALKIKEHPSCWHQTTLLSMYSSLINHSRFQEHHSKRT